MFNKLKYIFQCKKGINELKKLKKKYKDYLFIVVEHGIGDICIGLAYYSEWLNKHATEKHKLIIVQDKKYLIKDYNIELSNVLYVSYSMIHNMNTAICSPYFRRIVKHWVNAGWLIPLCPRFFIGHDFLLDIPNLSAQKIIKYSAYHLDISARQSFPTVSYKYNGTIKTPFIIINPYSYSVNIPQAFFVNIADKLKGRGITVYTNLALNQEPIEGTESLCISPEELLFLAKEAKCIISVRSGILDYIISNSKNIIAIYNNEQFMTLYSLKAWECNCNIREYIYSDDLNIDLIVDEAMKYEI